MTESMEKCILSLDEAVAWRQELRRQNRKLVVTNGCFDVLHRGNVEYINESRALGDALLLLVNSDDSARVLKGDDGPYNDEYSRAYLLCCLKAVDRVVIFDSCFCHSELTVLKPDIYVKGGDYTIETLNINEKKALFDAGSVICFKPLIKGFSNNDLIQKISKNIQNKDVEK